VGAPADVADWMSGGVGCAFSADGLVWYAPRGDRFPPAVARFARCARGSPTLAALPYPALPEWALPAGRTSAIFVAGSLQDDLSRRGTLEMFALARQAGIPMTWMLGNLVQLRANRDLFARGHDAFGDDLQIEPYDDLRAATIAALPWFRLVATVDGGGHERDIAHDRRMGARAFWGTVWNASGIDGIADRGVPWGTYCADPSSYKRPAASGCSLLGIEWTARDLTRAYFTGHEEAYSTDPDDLYERAALDRAGAAGYARALVDAYAAAGETQPLVMMAQQEAAGAGLDPMGTWSVLSAMYGEARRAGMHALTMSDAVARMEDDDGRPRAVAFPYVPGLPTVYGAPPGIAQAPFPATIDYVDRTVAMTFVAGQAVPLRTFDYRLAGASQWNVPLPQVAPGEFARLDLAAVGGGAIAVQLDAPVAQRFGLAFWSDPARLGLRGASVVPAGHAGAVAVFDLAPGVTQRVLACAACTRGVLPYAR
jgi:hypothetical protein